MITELMKVLVMLVRLTARAGPVHVRLMASIAQCSPQPPTTRPMLARQSQTGPHVAREGLLLCVNIEGILGMGRGHRTD